MNGYNNGYNFESSNNLGYKNKRNIPLTIMLRIWLASALTIIGIILSLFMLPFSLTMVPFSDIFSTSFNSNDPVAIGIIIESNETSAEIGSESVYEYKYQYQLPDGRIYARTGYNTGERKNTGEEIGISYKQSNPAKFRAVDLRNSLFEGYTAAIFILLFQAGGLTMLYSGTRKALRRIYILRVGVISNAKLVNRNPPDDLIDERAIYDLTFEFTASDSKIYKVVFTLSSVKNITDEGYEILVYDPEKPEKAVLLDQLPKGIKNLFLRLV